MSQATELIATQMAAGAIIKKQWGDAMYNVLVEGLTGDGVTDDTAKLQALVDKAISAGRKAIFFPHGTYYVTSLTNADKVSFFGDNASFVGGYTGTIHQIGDAATSLGLLDDVDPTPPTNTQVLQYEAASSKWKPKDKGLFNAASLNYGGATSQVHIQNNEGQKALTLQHSETSALTTPFDTMTVLRDVSSQGGTTKQTGGVIVKNTVQAACNHHEFGYFSILDNYATAATEQVGIYSQVNSLITAASSLWGGVYEVRNTRPEGGGSSVDSVLCGLEIDVVNKNAFSDTIKKIGVEAIAYGGGENTEAFSVYAANNIRGNGTYESGHWRYGFRILTNAIHATLGVGLQIKSSHGTGLEITGVSQNYAINLQADGATTTGLNIGANYTNPIAIQANKKIKMNGEASTEGVYYKSTDGAVTLISGAIGVEGHTTPSTATAGGGQALPPSVTGYLKVFVNGFEKRIPYYNI